jgi:PAS domain S-box-containing protein/putative nucleotidyltransferase with HDIG domain
MGFDGKFKHVNPAWKETLGYCDEELLGRSYLDLIHPDDRESTLAEARRVVQGQGSLLFANRMIRKDGAYSWLRWNVIPDMQQAMVYCVARDITSLREANEKIRTQLGQLQALREIDKAITASFDIKVTLNVILDQVLAHLHADSAAILKFNRSTDFLELVAGKGFKTSLISETSLRGDEGYAGKTISKRMIVHVPHLCEADPPFERDRLVRDESFISYYAAPLTAKGKIEGVLEVFFRKEFQGSKEWLEFLQTIAGQAAIAIDNAALYDNLQQSNLELTIAYDRTLEGWIKALELRSHETEQHTRRVTQLTIKIARAMGIHDERLTHFWRGALLHDIGKMAIPDSILKKPKGLDSKEWEEMRKHPVYAHQFLSPIPYLKPALEIPYCHHERWDGSGYPRGLKAEEIPLGARIFAVIDVWDALLSDRPYRQAWPRERVLQYISDESGKLFDPNVVKLFLSLIEKESQH